MEQWNYWTNLHNNKFREIKKDIYWWPTVNQTSY